MYRTTLRRGRFRRSPRRPAPPQLPGLVPGAAGGLLAVEVGRVVGAAGGLVGLAAGRGRLVRRRVALRSGVADLTLGLVHHHLPRKNDGLSGDGERTGCRRAGNGEAVIRRPRRALAPGGTR